MSPLNVATLYRPQNIPWCMMISKPRCKQQSCCRRRASQTAQTGEDVRAALLPGLRPRGLAELRAEDHVMRCTTTMGRQGQLYCLWIFCCIYSYIYLWYYMWYPLNVVANVYKAHWGAVAIEWYRLLNHLRPQRLRVIRVTYIHSSAPCLFPLSAKKVPAVGASCPSPGYWSSRERYTQTPHTSPAMSAH